MSKKSRKAFSQMTLIPSMVIKKKVKVIDLLVIKDIEDMNKQVDACRAMGLSIGFVPTMGYLHNGHISLIEKAREDNDVVVVSIFVNPLQFGPTEDFESYPRDLENDLSICKDAGVDIIFTPSSEVMATGDNLIYVDVKRMDSVLCGAKRPGHFRGVCTIVAKLFNIAKPDKAYFGEKDAQQLAIITRMVKDLNFNLDIIPCPIVRENDGLAMSSRNAYLDPEERQAATIISKSLELARKQLEKNEKDAVKLKNLITDNIETEDLAKIDYVDIVDSKTLMPVEVIDDSVLVAVAVFIGNTRLIDNFTFREVSECF